MNPFEAYLHGYLDKEAAVECMRGEPGKGQEENRKAGLPARGMGKMTGMGRKRIQLMLEKIHKKHEEKEDKEEEKEKED